jgi:hypothetical protein
MQIEIRDIGKITPDHFCDDAARAPACPHRKTAADPGRSAAALI